MGINEIGAGCFSNPYGEFDYGANYKNGGYNFSAVGKDQNLFEYEKRMGNLSEKYYEIDQDNDGSIDVIQRVVADVSDEKRTLTLLHEMYYPDSNKFDDNLIHQTSYYKYDENKNITTTLRTFQYDKNLDGNSDFIEQKEYRNEDYTKVYSNAVFSDYDYDSTFDSKRIVEIDLDGNVVKNNSKIDNKYHKGDDYTVQADGSNVKIINNSTGAVVEADLNMITKDNEDQDGLIKALQATPGELLIDVLQESKFATGHRKDNRSYYSVAEDKIYIHEGRLNLDTIAHETGHAFDHGDNVFDEKGNPLSYTITDDKDFLDTYNKELQAFLADGNQRRIETYYPDMNMSVIDSDGPYCTKDEKEMFAESYELMMTGDCPSKECIEKYFPESFKKVQAAVEKRREVNAPKKAQEQKGFSLSSFLDNVKQGIISAVKGAVNFIGGLFTNCFGLIFG